MGMNRRMVLGLVVLGVVVLGALFFILLDDGSGSDNGSRRSSKVARELIDSSPADFESRVRNGFDVPVDQLLADYRILMQYPPNSRPLRPSDVGLIDFQRIKMPEDPVLVEKGGRTQEPEYTCVLQPDRHVVFEGALVEAVLLCHDSGRKGPVRVETKKILLERLQDDANGKTQRFGLPSPEVLVQKDNRVSIRYRPRREDWGNVAMKVDFAIPGAASVPVQTRSAVFFVSPETPAVFTGIIDEGLVDGSLVVTVGLNVRRAGRYEIEANLFGTEGQPITYAREKVRLRAGPQSVKLLFFGKIFHDRNVSGPYLLRGLRGHQDTGLDPDILLLPPDEVTRRLAARHGPAIPDRRIIPPFEKEHRTVAYPLAEFSNREYDSPEKRERLRRLQEMERRE